MRQYVRIAREIVPLALSSPLSKLADIVGSAVEIAVVTVALRGMLGFDYASSVLVAMIIAGAGGTGLWFSPIGANLAAEASLSPRELRRIERLVRLALDAVVNPPITFALTAVSAALGIVHWRALEPLNLAALAVPPLLLRSGINSLMMRLRALMLRWMRAPFIPSWGHPSTLREAALLIFEALWMRLVHGVLLGTLTPIYYSLRALHPALGFAVAVLNPYALSIEVARSIITMGSAPPLLLLGLLALSAFWFAVDMVEPL